MRKSKVGSDDFCGIEMRSMKKESTKVFVYFESDSTVEKILKNHSRTIDGRRVNIQQAIVENLKKQPTTRKVIIHCNLYVEFNVTNNVTQFYFYLL